MTDKNETADRIQKLPEWARPIMECITSSLLSDNAAILVNYVSSFVLSDVECDLETLESLPDSLKEICIMFFTSCLRQGLTLEEHGMIVSIILPLHGIGSKVLQ